MSYCIAKDALAYELYRLNAALRAGEIAGYRYEKDGKKVHFDVIMTMGR